MPTHTSGTPFGLLDRAISTEERDKFGHAHYARLLRDYVESADFRPPYSVGLLGRWGMGKSSVKDLYLHHLEEDRTAKPARSETVKAATFNAWRYGGENVRRALLRTVFLSLGGDDGEIADTLFNQVQKPATVPKNRREIGRELYDKGPWLLVQVLTVAVLTLALAWLVAGVLHLTDTESRAATALVFGLISTWLTTVILDPKRFGVSRYASVTRVELPTVTAEQYEQLLVRRIAAYKKRHAECQRVVVFVDDLDRLSAKEMVDGLDAVRALMEVSEEALDGVGIVFVISCDEDKVADALYRRRRQEGADIPGVIQTKVDARRYLDRIFQFRLDIPPLPRQDMRSYVTERLRTELPDVATAVEQRVPLAEVVGRMIHVGVQSPRNALQILNAFAQGWHLAELREREAAGNSKPGGLSEGAVTQYPETLAVLAALRVDFADFYAHLQDKPDLIARFTDVFIRKRHLAEQPEAVQLVLRQYATDDSLKAAAENPDQPVEVHPEHRPLRQYLSSVASVPWPPSLQPLLLFSQDPVTRQTGDQGARVFEALVSGDADGVLEVLGRNLDVRPLEAVQVQLLRDVNDPVAEETDDRRDNAARALAALAPRYPEAQAAYLLVPIARRLTESRPLRQLIGVEHAAALLPRVPDAECRAVAGAFAADLLKREGDIGIALPTGETPSLDEALEMARGAAELALGVWQRCGLSPGTEKTVADWLLVRHVGVGKKAQTLPFAMLDEWMGRFEGILLGFLGADYLDALADHLETSNGSGTDLVAAARRADTVLDGLWNTGEESRADLWRLAARFVALDAPELNGCAQRVFREHGAQASGLEASAFVAAATGRVTADLGDGASPEYADETDREAVTLIAAVAGGREDLAPNARQAVATLCDRLSHADGTTPDAVRLAESLQYGGDGELGPVLETWVARAMGDLPNACLDFVARSYETTLTDAQRTALAQQLTVAVNASPDPATASRYVRAIWDLPESAFGAEPLLSHAVGAAAALQKPPLDAARIQLFLPGARRFAETGPKGNAGTMLYDLARQASNNPDLQGALHGAMAGHWPTPSADLTSYGTDPIFAWGVSTITAGSNHSRIPEVLASISGMVRRGLVGADKETELLRAALAAWPFHREAAAKAITSCGTAPDPADVAKLAESVDPSDGDAVRELKDLWRAVEKRLTDDGRVQAEAALLGQQGRPLGPATDGFLSLWTDCAGGPALILSDVSRLFREGSLNEAQRLRAWKQVERRISALDLPDLLGAVRLGVSGGGDVTRSLFECLGQIGARFQTQADRLGLAEVIVSAMPLAGSRDAKVKLALWLQSVGNLTVLDRLPAEVSSSVEDLEVLAEKFPKNKKLLRLLSAAKKQQAEA